MDMFDGVGRRQDQVQGSFLDIGQHRLNGRERNCLFRNAGDGTFAEVGWVASADLVEDGRGLSVLDYDRDGRLDLVVRNYRQPAELLHNVGPAGHWLAVRLVGTRSNRDAVGARVRLRTADGWQLREVSAGSGYASGSSLVQHFGLGGQAAVEALEVAWPSGVQTTVPVPAVDRLITLHEP
jgi:hypothetical protein